MINDIKSAVSSQDEKALLIASQNFIDYIGDTEVEDAKDAKILNSIKTAMNNKLKKEIVLNFYMNGRINKYKIFKK